MSPDTITNTPSQLEICEANAFTFKKELAWLNDLVLYRAYIWQKTLFKQKLNLAPAEKQNNSFQDPDENPLFTKVKNIGSKTPLDPALPEAGESPYADFVLHYEFDVVERTLLMLGLLPYLVPGTLESFFTNTRLFETYPSDSCCRKSENGNFYPTGDTLMFLLAGGDLALRMKLHGLFEKTHAFHKHNILRLADVAKNESRLSGQIIVDSEIVDMFTLGYVRPPQFNNDFPAKQISTDLEWEDLILSPQTKRQVEEVKIWIRNYDRLMNELGMGKRLRPGNKILFYGPPGTGKTLTAQLLGKYIRKDVFRIDLSMVVNKYVGETEKNLAKIFDRAEHSDWILFFDEADALFGTRTKVSSSNDRYANQEVSYLLQRIEDFKGIVILASNLKGNIDDAFLRRFNNVVHFPFPKQDERHQLWQKAFSEKIILAPDVDIRRLSEKFEMSGGHIMNVVAWCSMMALEKNDYTVTEPMLREGMARELAKEGRTL